MTRFASKRCVLIGLNAALGAAILWYVDRGRSYEQWQTDSVLYATPRDTKFDLVLLGSSRAERFTRIRANLDCLELELGVNVLGLASPFGGGLVPAEMFLANFYARNNRTQTVLFFLDPFVFFSRGPNEGHKFVYYEPVRPAFLRRMIKNGFDHRRIITYVRSKFSLAWINQGPVPIQCARRALTSDDLDLARMQMRMDSLYPDGLKEEAFRRYAKVLGRILDMACRHDARVVIVFAPVLLGADPGRPKIDALLDEYDTQYDFTVHDFTHAVEVPSLFADFDHLNSEGVEYFVRNVLKPALEDAIRPARNDTGPGTTTLELANKSAECGPVDGTFVLLKDSVFDTF